MVKAEKILVNQLKLGMFISQLDRPWVETTFPLQGFMVKSKEDIDQLGALCEYVYVDHQKSHEYKFKQHAVLNKSQPARQQPRIKGTLGQFERVKYETTQPLKKEVAKATLYHSEVVRAMLHLLSDLRVDKPLNLRAARKAASVMVHSVIRNPDAMVWLVRLKDSDSYNYRHSVRSAILATVFGRHLGLPKDILENLATGTLLMDVGMVDLPHSITHAEGPLTDEQQLQWQKHVEYSVQKLQACRNVNDQMLALVQYHHERHDGSGFPFALEGKRIPLLARIAGLVEYYDMLTSPRPGITPLTSTQAVSHLYENRDITFQASLVEQFIQSIGVYPTGTLVELSDGGVGVVVAQNISRRLRPHVMRVLDTDKQPLAHPRIVDLLEMPTDQNGSKLSISRALEANSHAVNLDELTINAA